MAAKSAKTEDKKPADAADATPPAANGSDANAAAAKTDEVNATKPTDTTDTTPAATGDGDANAAPSNPPAAKPEVQADKEERREFVTVSLVRMAGRTRPVGSLLDLTRAEFDTFKHLKAIKGEWD